ncbi:TraB/GumN family protein [Vibrio makurazakiensis]|uniref:TraB/GumN family protein n=1 Tax=Vibrio makurazakiensis TaxID=2910250 RepID=UPI003D0998CD
MRRNTYALSAVIFFIGFLSHPVLSEPLYWSASKGNKELMIFGSVHVGNEEMYPLPVPVIEYLEKSDGLIVEADIRKNNNVQYPAAKYKSEDVLSKSLKQKLIEVGNSLNLHPQTLLMSPPWATALTLQMKQFESLGLEAQYGVDSFLIEKATLENIPVLGFEELQFQINLLTKLPKDGELLLISGLEEWDNSEKSAGCIIESWQSGDAANLLELGMSSEISPEMNERFVYSRNHNWIQRLNNNSFVPENSKHLIVVGTLHLVGEQNLLSLLQEDGYSVEQLSTSQKANCAF